MRSSKFVTPVIGMATTLWQGATESARWFVPMLQKPSVALHWVTSARAAQFIFGLVVLVNLFVFPPARDAMLERAFKNESFSDRFAGMLGSSRMDRRRANAQSALTLFIWLSSCGALAALMWLRIPRSIASAEKISRKKSETADALLDRRPTESVAMYESALRLTLDVNRQSELKDILKRAVAAPVNAKATVALAGEKDGVLEAGLVAGRYRVVRELGNGATGVVHLAEDTVLNRSVALKEMSMVGADQDARARFQREARILAQLNHPNIVQVYDLVERQYDILISMELVEGGDLSQHLSEHLAEHPETQGALSVSTVIEFATAIANGVAFAHARGIVHRDLKPMNVLLTPDGTPKISDFGLAKIAHGTSHTVEGTILGSPYYMSPEQADGRVASQASDIYALGIIIFQMVSGAPPFRGELASVLMQHIRRPAPVLSDVVEVPSALSDLVASMLAKDPSDRPANMDAVGSALEALAGIPAERG